MNHKCPICNEEFNSLDVFDEHIENHKNESILSNPLEIKSDTSNDKKAVHEINFKKIFDKEKFEKLTEYKILEISDIEESISRRNFIEQVKKIYQKNPFCYVPNFVENLINGFAVGKLQDEFHFHSNSELQNILKNILNFKEDRYRLAQYPNAFELNLQIHGWEDRYNDLLNNFNFFKDELIELFFESVLQAYLILILMDKYIERSEIYQLCLELKSNYKFFRFIDESLGKEFNNLLNNNLKNRIDLLLDELILQKIIHFKNTETKKLKSSLNMDDIKNNIKKQLDLNDGVLIQSSLETLVNQEFPILKLIPGMNIFEASLDELDRQNLIHKEQRGYRQNDFQIFLSDDFKKIESDIKYLENTGNIPFKGRKITPEIFVSELLELEKGDFDDEDDQVTRLAGLVLAESITLQSTPEIIPEFDFTINMKYYNFRPEQIEVMKKLNFKLQSDILHVKVMINEIFNLKKYKILLEKIPENEQGVIVTFKKIPINIKKLLDEDYTLQIINEDGVKTWASITPILPSRVNSICKIYSDPLSKLENKIVKINSVFYEKGIAIVSIFPELNEVTVLVRSLEEIPLFESHHSDFNSISKNYFEFIKILTNCTMNDDLINGFFKNKFTEDLKYSKPIFKIKFDYNTVNLNFEGHDKKDIFNCDCIKYAENSLHLCSHLVTAIDHIFRFYSYGDDSWNNSNHMKRGLENFLQKNIEIILDRLDVTEELGGIKDKNRVMAFISGTIKTENRS